MLLTRETKLCMSLAARPGNFGTLFHNYLYKKLQLDFVYKAFATTHLEDAIKGIKALGIRGCALSMPFKEECIPWLDQLDYSANSIQSVNTIVNNAGNLKGYNTDYIAVEQLLKEHQIEKESRFALRGNGGMARAILAALINNGYKKGVVVVRRAEAGAALAQEFHCDYQLDTEPIEADLLINATPIGMQGGLEEQLQSFTDSEIEQSKVVFDVVAMPIETPLLRAAKRQGKKTLSGADVAVIQSLEQFVLYTGVRPSREVVEESYRYTRALLEQLE